MIEKFLLIVFLFIFLLKPEEIKFFLINIVYIYSNINKIINYVKNKILKLFNF